MQRVARLSWALAADVQAKGVRMRLSYFGGNVARLHNETIDQLFRMEAHMG
jgi:hypothetical protein